MSSPLGFVLACVFADSGERLHCASSEGLVNVWQVPADKPPTARRVAAWPGHTGAVNTLASQAGRLYSGGDDGRLLCRDVHSGDVFWHTQPSGARVLGVAATADSVVAACSDGVLRLFAAADGVPAVELRGHTGAVHAVAAAGNWLVSAGSDGRVGLWDAAAHCHVAWLEGHAAAVNAVVATGPAEALTLDAQGVLCLWDLDAQDLLWQIDELGQPGWALAAHPAQGFAVATGAGFGVEIDLASGASVGLPGASGFASRAVAIHPGGRWLALGHDRGAVQLYNSADGVFAATLAGA